MYSITCHVNRLWCSDCALLQCIGEHHAGRSDGAAGGCMESMETESKGSEPSQPMGRSQTHQAE